MHARTYTYALSIGMKCVDLRDDLIFMTNDLISMTYDLISMTYLRLFYTYTDNVYAYIQLYIYIPYSAYI